MALNSKGDIPQTKEESRVVHKKTLSNGSIRNRLICCLLLVSLAPILIIGFLSYYNAREAITNKTTQYSQAELMQTVANIQSKLAEFENTSVRLFITKGFNTNLATLSGVEDETQLLLTKREVESYFKEYMISNQDIF